MEIFLIRHAQTQGNIERRYIGRIDQPLYQAHGVLKTVPDLGGIDATTQEINSIDFLYPTAP